MSERFSSIEAVQRLIRVAGDDPDRPGLKDTPARVLKAYEEMFSGYKDNPAEILAKTFPDDQQVEYNEMVVVKDIEFWSVCEHHLLPFYGTAAVAYLPNSPLGFGVFGLSKLARLVDCFARRLQVQERMTNQIADALYRTAKTHGAACVTTATHMCMACRGVRQAGATTVTSALRGAFRDDQKARGEFLSLIRS